MKRWIPTHLLMTLLMALTLFPAQGQAVKISQNLVEDQSVIRIQNRIDCRPQEPLCRQICNGDACVWFEPTCRDCLASGDTVLREVFQTLVPSYRGAHLIDETSVILRLLRQSTILVSSRGVYDFHNRSDDSSLSQGLVQLCGSAEGFVSVLLDDAGRPTRAYMAICLSPQGIVGRRLQPADEASLERQGNESTPVLKLKLDYELKSFETRSPGTPLRLH